MVPDVPQAKRPCSTVAMSETENEWIDASSHHHYQETHGPEAALQTNSPHPIAKGLESIGPDRHEPKPSRKATCFAMRYRKGLQAFPIRWQ